MSATLHRQSQRFHNTLRFRSGLARRNEPQTPKTTLETSAITEDCNGKN